MEKRQASSRHACSRHWQDGGGSAHRGAEPRHMSDFTFIHAADLHLDSPLRGLDGLEDGSACFNA